MDNTLQSIENLPRDADDENENSALLEFRFQARNLGVDWRKLSLIDVDHIAQRMDIDQLQEHIELVTYASLDELDSVDPLFVKLFRLSQYTIEYLLHSQDYLKGVMQREKLKLTKKDEVIKSREVTESKLRAELVQVKKENKKRRRMIEEYQRMMEVGANAFYKCPICPSKSFINATYLQSHMHRKHQEHSTYIGDAILHTKAITQNVQDKLITVQDQIELEKRRNHELEEKRQLEAKRAEEKIFEQQEHIQRLERTRYESKLAELDQSFQTELDQMKMKERSHIARINELEEKSAKLARTESMVKSLQKELPKIEDHVHTKLDDLETSLRHEQSVLAAKMREPSPRQQQQPRPVKSVTRGPKKSVAYQESPIDLEAERARQREQLIQQFRPSMITLLNSKLDELGLTPAQDRLSDNMYKMKREQLRNNRAHKTGSISNFHIHRNDVEGHLEHRVSEIHLSNGPVEDSGFAITSTDQRQPQQHRPKRPVSGPPLQTLKRKPKRPANPPSPTPPPPQSTATTTRQQLSTSATSSPGKPHFASTMKTPSSQPQRHSTDVASSSDWADSERPPARKAMKEFNEKVLDSVDVETITEKTEEDQTSAWSDDSDFSVGRSVKKKADQIETQLANRGAKPPGGHDVTGIQDQTNMAVDELFDDDSELGDN